MTIYDFIRSSISVGTNIFHFGSKIMQNHHPYCLQTPSETVFGGGFWAPNTFEKRRFGSRFGFKIEITGVLQVYLQQLLVMVFDELPTKSAARPPVVSCGLHDVGTPNVQWLGTSLSTLTITGKICIFVDIFGQLHAFQQICILLHKRSLYCMFLRCVAQPPTMSRLHGGVKGDMGMIYDGME